MGKMAVMDHTGHLEISWDPDVEDEVTQAAKTFNEMKDRGYVAYLPHLEGTRGEVMKAFDPTAESIIMRAPMAGG